MTQQPRHYSEERFKKGIVIIASEPEWKDDDIDTLMDHLEAFAYNADSYEELIELPERYEVRAELVARLAARPDDAGRERCARAAFDAFYAEGTPYSEIERDMFRQVADAVIAALIAPKEDQDAN